MPTSVRLLSKRLPLQRRLLFLCVVFVFCLLLLEAGSHAVLYIQAFHLDGLQHERVSIINGIEVSPGAAEVIHPYLGWLHNPQNSSPHTAFGQEIPVNRLGFRDTIETIRKRNDDTYLIGIAGGSVAWQFSISAQQEFCRLLEESPELQGRKVQLIRLALPGFKQPQQLQALSFVLAMGGEFDALINIDGYNEAALSISDNYDVGTFIAYPRAWHVRATQIEDPRFSADTLEILQTRAERQSLAIKMEASRLKRSAFFNLLWKHRDIRLLERQFELTRILSVGRKDNFLYNGPKELATSESEAKEEAVQLWKRSSRQLSRLCQANTAHYLHVLQPNQYDRNSKPLSPYEIEKCYAPDERSSQMITELYPRLKQLGHELNQEGVSFLDASDAFADVSETLYTDFCCHFNDDGNLILARLIAERFLADLKEHPSF